MRTFATAQECLGFVTVGMEVVCLRPVHWLCRTGEFGKIVEIDHTLLRILWNESPAKGHSGWYCWDWLNHGGSIAIVDYVNEWEGELELL